MEKDALQALLDAVDEYLIYQTRGKLEDLIVARQRLRDSNEKEKPSQMPPPLEVAEGH